MILGLSYFVSHNSSVAMLSDSGTLECACSEESLTRRKRDGTFPVLSREWAKSVCGNPDRIVASYWDRNGFEKQHEGIFDRARASRLSGVQQTHESTLRDAGVTEFTGHHYSHAAGAFYTSGFADAVVITYDGGISCEPWLATVWIAKGGQLTPLRQCTQRDGATAAIRYSAVTSLLGFRPNHDEGKVTGLAGTGSPSEGCIETLTKAFNVLKEHEAYYNGSLAHLFGNIRQKYSVANIAASIQKMTEDAVTTLLLECVSDPAKTNCVMAGGLFANVRLNLRIKQLGFKQIYVFPAMGDEGLGAGSALAYAVSKGVAPRSLQSVYVGPLYSDEDIVAALERLGLNRFCRTCSDIEGTTATLLAEGHTVARFTGNMEFGPRALGNRSILYKSDDISTNRWLNDKLKRSETMPFAPVTLAEVADQMYMELDGLTRCTQFMTTVVPCTDLMRRLSPAVVHVDGTARPQIVSSTSNPSLHRILSEVHRLTGVPNLINTSLNMHGEPIVCSPTDAIACFLRARLDYLAINNYLVRSPYLEKTTRDAPV